MTGDRKPRKQQGNRQCATQGLVRHQNKMELGARGDLFSHRTALGGGLTGCQPLSRNRVAMLAGAPPGRSHPPSTDAPPPRLPPNRRAWRRWPRLVAAAAAAAAVWGALRDRPPLALGENGRGGHRLAPPREGMGGMDGGDCGDREDGRAGRERSWRWRSPPSPPTPPPVVAVPGGARSASRKARSVVVPTTTATRQRLPLPPPPLVERTCVPARPVSGEGMGEEGCLP